MARDDAGEIVQDFQEDQGLKNSEMLELCVEYINNQGDNAAFEAFLMDHREPTGNDD